MKESAQHKAMAEVERHSIRRTMRRNLRRVSVFFDRVVLWPPHGYCMNFEKPHQIHLLLQKSLRWIYENVEVSHQLFIILKHEHRRRDLFQRLND